MSLRIPTAIENHGDARRLSQALGAFIVWLDTYPPVRARYHTWRATRDHADQEFELLLAEYPETIERYITEITWRNHAAMRPFVETLLHRLPPTWVDMTTSELLLAFRTRHYHGRTRADVPPATPPATPPQFGVQVQLTASHPRGRVSEDPAVIQRGVDYLCRHYVKEPRDRKRALAREFGASAQWNDPEDAVRFVKNSIQQAWALLDLAAAATWSPTVPGRIVVPPTRDSTL
jgi:hypothetical protein